MGLNKSSMSSENQEHTYDLSKYWVNMNTLRLVDGTAMQSLVMHSQVELKYC